MTVSAMRLHALTLEGFKSFRDRTEVTFGDLTILTGANNAGKSTLMQPVLLMKQTLEAGYDRGLLLLQGPNVVISSAEALFWTAQGRRAPFARLGLTLSSGGSAPNLIGYEVVLKMNEAALPPLALVEATWRNGERLIVVPGSADSSAVRVERCFAMRTDDLPAQQHVRGSIETLLLRMIYVPAARSLALPRHPVVASHHGFFPGRFPDYVPSLIYAWQTLLPQTLQRLNQDLRALKLAGHIEATKVSDSEVSLSVGRLSDEATQDKVNLADAGAGIDHALPIIAALLAAGGGQLVYLEEPEVHLHPRIVRELAPLMLNAVRRGAQVVVETQSDLLLFSLQLLVAQKQFTHYTVRLHWLYQDPAGVSRCKSADLDDRGTFGDLPIDLDEAAMDAQEQYLDATLAD